MKIDTQEQLEAILESHEQRLKAFHEKLRDYGVMIHDFQVSVDALKMQHSLANKLRGRQRGRPPDHGKRPQTVAQLHGKGPRMTKLRPQDFVARRESTKEDA